jgi:hypothetical protein
MATAGAPLSFSLSVKNLGYSVWHSAGTARVRVAVYLDPAGATPQGAETPITSSYLTGDVAPGATTKLTLHLTTPKTRGSYVVRVRLLGDDGSVSDFLIQSPLQLT